MLFLQSYGQKVKQFNPIIFEIQFWLEFFLKIITVWYYDFFFSQLEERYAVAAETRNNLVAASQNIQGAQRYLSNIQFPYCAPPEVDTLNKVSFI